MKMHMRAGRIPWGIRSCWLLAALGFGGVLLRADDWPQWRGPKRNGISAESKWRDQWPADGPATAWKANVGLGFSSFVVGDGRVFTLGHTDGKDSVFALDAATGKELWKHSYDAELGDKYFEGGTTGTPTIDGNRVFTLSRWGDVFCFEAATGKIVWSMNVQKETGVRVPDWGFAGAPLVHDNLLILNVGEAGVALDKGTGKIVWKSADRNAGYSTPLPYRNNGRTSVIIGSGEAYISVNPTDGREEWRIRWLTEFGVNAADPIVDGGRVFLCTGYGKGGALFKIGDGEPQQIWKTKSFHTQLNPGVLLDGHVYGADGDTDAKAALKCIDLATGVEKWAQPNFGSGGVTIADHRLIAMSGHGELMVAPASFEAFKPTARAQVLGGKCWTAPVLANGRIYCRNSRGDVVCVDVHL
jgi:outer membrane protein assembly factor BamB